MNEKRLKKYIEELKERSSRSTLDLVLEAAWATNHYSVSVRENEYTRPGANHGYQQWEEILEAGRSYMVGSEIPMTAYVRSHTSRLTCWQQLAYEYCKANPGDRLVVENNRFTYHVCARGEYVEFGLPYHDSGGEKHWVSNNGKSRVLVNVD